MMTVDLNTLDPRPNPMPKKTMTPRYKSKKIRKNGKIQKFNPWGSQNEVQTFSQK